MPTPEISANSCNSNVNFATVTVQATVNAMGSATQCVVLYGTSSTLSGASQFPVPPKSIGAGTSPVMVNETLPGLLAGTTYYWALRATNAAGSVTSQINQFRTEGTAPLAPQIVPNSLYANVNYSTVTVQANVNPNGAQTQYTFSYGTSPTLSGAAQGPVPAGSLAAASSPTIINLVLRGLLPGTNCYQARRGRDFGDHNV